MFYLCKNINELTGQISCWRINNVESLNDENLVNDFLNKKKTILDCDYLEGYSFVNKLEFLFLYKWLYLNLNHPFTLSCDIGIDEDFFITVSDVSDEKIIKRSFKFFSTIEEHHSNEMHDTVESLSDFLKLYNKKLYELDDVELYCLLSNRPEMGPFIFQPKETDDNFLYKLIHGIQPFTMCPTLLIKYLLRSIENEPTYKTKEIKKVSHTKSIYLNIKAILKKLFK